RILDRTCKPKCRNGRAPGNHAEVVEQRRHDFELFCSEVVIDEAGAGDVQEAEQRLSHLADMKELELSSEALALSRALLKRKGLPLKAKSDSFHLAIASVHGMDYLLTWNCRHLANASLRPLIDW